MFYKTNKPNEGSYSLFNRDVQLYRFHRETFLINKVFSDINLLNTSVLDFGGGYGDFVLFLLKIGFPPQNLYYYEISPERFKFASDILPSSINFLKDLNLLPIKSMNIVYLGTVLSSVLSESDRDSVSRDIKRLISDDGVIIIFDFFYKSPNQSVRAVTFHDLKFLFPEYSIRFYPLLLAPPILRHVIRKYPWLYNFLNLFRFLKTHGFFILKK